VATVTAPTKTTIRTKITVTENESRKSTDFNCLVNDIVKALIGLLLGVMGTSGIAIGYTVYTKGKQFKQMELAIRIRDTEIAQLTKQISYIPVPANISSLNSVDP